jgi:outer membrane protein assembly factor BamB
LRNRGRFTGFALLVAVLSLTLVGCTSQLGTSWAGLTVLEGGTSLAYAYDDRLGIVNVADGQPVPLLDVNGEPQVAENGDVIGWELRGGDFDNAKFFAPPLQLDDDTLLVTTLERDLLVVDLNTSETTLVAEAFGERGNAVSGATLADGMLLIGLQERLIALDAETYGTQWSVETAHGVWSSPVVLNDVVYFTSLDHFMYAVELDSGEVVWSLDLGGASASTPTYDPEREVFYVGTFNSTMLKVSVGGDLLDTYETDEWVWAAPTLAEDGMLYFADLSGVVYKLDPETMAIGDDGWKSRIAAGAIRMSPLVLDEHVVVGSRDERVYWVKRDTGVEDFNRTLGDEILSDLLYFPASEENDIELGLIVISKLSNREPLVAFGATDGQRIWPS